MKLKLLYKVRFRIFYLTGNKYSCGHVQILKIVFRTRPNLRHLLKIIITRGDPNDCPIFSKLNSNIVGCYLHWFDKRGGAKAVVKIYELLINIMT